MASRLTKITAMSLAELSGRSAQEVSFAWERWALGRFPRTPDQRLAGGLRSDLRGSGWRQNLLAARRTSRVSFFAGLTDPEASRTLFLAEYPQQAEQTVARARRALRHEFEVFGRLCSLGPQVNWHADPITGETWPLLFHRDVPFGDPASREGDVKHVWEINRHQHLIDLGKAWLITREDAFSSEVRRQVVDWIASNPYGLGVNWAGPLEVAYRALSWAWAYWLTDGSEGDDESEIGWLGGFLDHGTFLYRHLELYASPYNHLVGEAAVLYMLGVLFPELQEAERWRRRGRAVLEDRLAEQFYADGGSVEQAAVYHHATLGFYLLAALIGRRNGEELSPRVWSSIERAIDFAMHLMQPNGHLPAIGDNDDARPILFEWRSTWDFRHFQALGAVLYGRPDFKFAAGRFQEEAFWLLGPEAYHGFQAMPVQQPPISHHLAAAGYVVLRSGWDRDADYVCFDCGEQAGGLRRDGIASAAHGHADCLSIVAALGGQPVLVDSGFFTYNGALAWERYFRETAAHNTVRVNDRDQADHLEKMAWAFAPTATMHALHSAPSGGWAIGSHDGYSREAGVTHTRAVLLRHPGYIVVHDQLHGAWPYDAEWIWQFASGLEATATGADLSLSGRFVMTWVATESLTPVVRLGGPGPGDGWVAPHLGVRTSAPRLSLSVRSPGSISVLTVLADLAHWDAVTTDVSTDGERRWVIRIARGLLADTVVMSRGNHAGGGNAQETCVEVWRSESGTIVSHQNIHASDQE